MIKTNIKFIRTYESDGEYIDIIYKSGRESTISAAPFYKIPVTAVAFMVNAKKITEQYNSVLKRNEKIYEL